MMRFWVLLVGCSAVGWGCKCAPDMAIGPCTRTAAVVFAGTVTRTEPESWAAAVARLLSRVEPALAANFETGWSEEELRRAATSLLSEETPRLVGK